MKINRAKLVGSFVTRKIDILKATKNESSVRATLAHLRRGVGKPVGSLPELWEIFFDGFPEALEGRGEKASGAEIAVHTSLCLFALHQQGKDLATDCVHEKEISFGQAVAKMVSQKEELKKVKRRFDAAITAASVNEFVKHAQGLIKQLKTKEITMDYGLLAEEIYRYGYPVSRESIRLKWGRDFYRQLATISEKTDEGEKNE